MKASHILIDGTRYKLPDITYDKFVATVGWSGASDVAYAAYLHKNDMHDIGDFNEESLADATLIITLGNGDELSFKRSA